jgi:hypothetical protein
VTVTIDKIPELARVEIYWNLHKDCYSVRACSGPQRGRVVAHVSSFVMKNVDLVVRQAGRRKVLETGRKNVHAFARGEWTVIPQSTLTSGETLTYSPWKFDSFVTTSGHQPVNRTMALTGTIEDARPVLRPSILWKV